MAKRNHPLQIGEKVYDLNTQYIYHIVGFNENGTVQLGMSDWDITENLKMFDCELTEEEYEAVAFPDDLYQFVPGLVARDGNEICYEHQDTEDEYPYFSPYLYENLFTFETFTPDEWKKAFLFQPY